MQHFWANLVQWIHFTNILIRRFSNSQKKVGMVKNQVKSISDEALKIDIQKEIKTFFKLLTCNNFLTDFENWWYVQGISSGFDIIYVWRIWICRLDLV